MSNKGTSTNGRKSRATTRDYAPRKHEEKDKVRDKKNYAKKTTKDHKHAIRVYEEWVEEYGDEYEDNLSLERGREPLDLATLCSFFRFHAASAIGKLDPDERITTRSLVAFTEWFFAAYKKITRVRIPSQDTSAVYKWAREDLYHEGVVVIREKPKYLFGVQEWRRFITTFWTVDESHFLHPRNRVQIPFLIGLYCWTGARIGAFLPGIKDKTQAGLRYRDIELVLLPESLEEEEKEELRRTSLNYRGWTACFRVDQRWTKGNLDPTTTARGSSTIEHGKLLFDDTQYLIALAIADNAIHGVNSVEEFWALEIKLTEDFLVIPWRNEAKGLPILRNATISQGVTEDPLPQSTFERILKDIGRRSGYFGNCTVHAVRRGTGNQIEKYNTNVQRCQHMGHKTNDRTFQDRYLANTSSCDGKAAFLNEKPQYNHVDLFQSFAVLRENGLPTKLSAEKEAAIRRLPHIAELQKSVAQHKDLQKEHRRELGKARKNGYKEYVDEWIEERRKWRITSHPKELPDDLVKTDLTQILHRIMPERARLAHTMISDRIVTEDERKQAVKDLCSLATQDCTVVYRPDEKPVNGVCPVKGCGAQMSQIAKPQRSNHIHACRHREVACQLKLPRGELKYCYFCFKWFPEDTWDKHCQYHLDTIDSRCCESITYCSTFLRPALCPFCLGDNRPGIPASQRWKSWTREGQLRDHIQKVHLEREQVRWPSTCPHPLCKTKLDDQVSFVYHLIDIHSLTMNEAQQQKLASASYNGCQLEHQKRKADNGTGPRPSKQAKLAQDQHWRNEQLSEAPRTTRTYDSESVPCALDTMALTPHCSLDPGNDTWISEFIRSPSPSQTSFENREDGDSGYHTEQAVDPLASFPIFSHTSLEDGDSDYHTEQAVDQPAIPPSPSHTSLTHGENNRTEQVGGQPASSIEELSFKGPKRLRLSQPKPPLKRQFKLKLPRLSQPKPPSKKQPRACPKSSHKAQPKPIRKLSLRDCSKKKAHGRRPTDG